MSVPLRLVSVDIIGTLIKVWRITVLEFVGVKGWVGEERQAEFSACSMLLEKKENCGLYKIVVCVCVYVCLRKRENE